MSQHRYPNRPTSLSQNPQHDAKNTQGYDRVHIVNMKHPKKNTWNDDLLMSWAFDGLPQETTHQHLFDNWCPDNNDKDKGPTLIGGWGQKPLHKGLLLYGPSKKSTEHNPQCRHQYLCDRDKTNPWKKPDGECSKAQRRKGATEKGKGKNSTSSNIRSLMDSLFYSYHFFVFYILNIFHW